MKYLTFRLGGLIHVTLLSFSLLLCISSIKVIANNEVESWGLFYLYSIIIPYFVYPFVWVIILYELRDSKKSCNYSELGIRSYFLCLIYTSINTMVLTSSNNGLLESVPIPYLIPWWYFIIIPQVIFPLKYKLLNRSSDASCLSYIALVVFLIDVFCKILYFSQYTLLYVPIISIFDSNIIVQLAILAPFLISVSCFFCTSLISFITHKPM